MKVSHQSEDSIIWVILNPEKTDSMYKYLFGPVPSRRLGMSLGVDLVPKKVCTLDCVYCEVGKTTRLAGERKAFIKPEKIKEELADYFAHHPDPDFITFSGYGEPTLNSATGEILDFIKEIKPGIPAAVITNGTLFSDKEVRNSLIKADVVLPSLDAASELVFRKINRPSEKIRIEEYINGLISFREEFKGKIWLEVFILPGFNDDEKELVQIKKAILKIRPDSVQLNTLDRPGTESGIRGATRAELLRVKDFWNLENVEIIAAPPGRHKLQSYRTDIENAILETISRRPCTAEDLHQFLGISLAELKHYLDILAEENRITSVIQERGVFFTAK